MDNRFWLMTPDMDDPALGHVEPFGPDTWALVDEDEGGIVAYISGINRANEICNALNTRN